MKEPNSDRQPHGETSGQVAIPRAAFATSSSHTASASLERAGEGPRLIRPTPRVGDSRALPRFVSPSPRTLQAAELNRTDAARQIREKFENLVRASPSPKALLAATNAPNPGISALPVRLPHTTWQQTPQPSKVKDPLLARLFSGGTATPGRPKPQQKAGGPPQNQTPKPSGTGVAPTVLSPPVLPSAERRPASGPRQGQATAPGSSRMKQPAQGAEPDSHAAREPRSEDREAETSYKGVPTEPAAAPGYRLWQGQPAPVWQDAFAAFRVGETPGATSRAAAEPHPADSEETDLSDEESMGATAQPPPPAQSAHAPKAAASGQTGRQSLAAAVKQVVAEHGGFEGRGGDRQSGSYGGAADQSSSPGLHQQQDPRTGSISSALEAPAAAAEPQGEAPAAEPAGSEGELGMQGVEALLRDFGGQEASKQHGRPASGHPEVAAEPQRSSPVALPDPGVSARNLAKVGLLEDRLGLPASEPAESSNLLSQPSRHEPEGSQSPPAEAGAAEASRPERGTAEAARPGTSGLETPPEQPATAEAEVLNPSRLQSARHNQPEPVEDAKDAAPDAPPQYRGRGRSRGRGRGGGRGAGRGRATDRDPRLRDESRLQMLARATHERELADAQPSEDQPAGEAAASPEAERPPSGNVGPPSGRGAGRGRGRRGRGRGRGSRRLTAAEMPVAEAAAQPEAEPMSLAQPEPENPQYGQDSVPADDSADAGSPADAPPNEAEIIPEKERRRLRKKTIKASTLPAADAAAQPEAEPGLPERPEPEDAQAGEEPRPAGDSAEAVRPPDAPHNVPEPLPKKQRGKERKKSSAAADSSKEAPSSQRRSGQGASSTAKKRKLAAPAEDEEPGSSAMPGSEPEAAGQVAAESDAAAKSKLQVSRRTGRVRAPPVAFWANQSLRVDPKSGTVSIQDGFVDQLSHLHDRLAPRRQQAAQQPKSPAQKPSSEAAAKQQSPQAAKIKPSLQAADVARKPGQPKAAPLAARAVEAGKAAAGGSAALDAQKAASGPASKKQRKEQPEASNSLGGSRKRGAESSAVGSGEADRAAKKSQLQKASGGRGAKKRRRPVKAADVEAKASASLAEADQETEADDEEGEVAWSCDQLTALKAAVMKEPDPGASNFWQRVACRVPGKTGEQCQDKYMSLYGATPATKPRGGKSRRSDTAAAAPAGRRGGNKLSQAAARKLARQARQEQREADAQARPPPEDAEEEEARLAEQQQKAEWANRYVTASLRRKGAQKLWGGGFRAPRPAQQPPAAGPAAAAKQQALVGQIVGMVASGSNAVPEEDSEEEKDDYFSDASDE